MSIVTGIQAAQVYQGNTRDARYEDKVCFVEMQYTDNRTGLKRGDKSNIPRVV
jgi:hypothetical protein